MDKIRNVTWLWHPAIWLDRRMLWLLIISNGLGTIYGYIWYGNQIEYTLTHMEAWLLPFVPDSPTASLFFTLALMFMLFNGRLHNRKSGFIRGFIEAFAVITSIKYGIWAVWMILMGYAQGNSLVWQDYMLIASHLAMAVEAIVYARFFAYRWLAIGLVALWTLWNDLLDYTIGIFPWLPPVLLDDLTWIAWFTVLLSLCSIIAAIIFNQLFRGSRL